MKVPYYHKDNEGPLEVYKMQTSIFSSLHKGSVLIYNEDRTQIWEETNQKNVKALKKFMGKNVIKCYTCGYQNKKRPNSISR